MGGWRQWRDATRVVCEKRMLLKLEGEDIQYGRTSNDLWHRNMSSQENRREGAGKNRTKNVETCTGYIA